MVYVPKASSSVLTATVPTSYPTRVVAGHTVVDLPGGWFVQSSSKYLDAPLRWVRLSPFSAAIAPVTEAQYRTVMGADGAQGGNPASAPEEPATCVSWDQAAQYCVAVNAAHGTEIGLLTDAEGEYASRGPVVNLRAVMQAEGIGPDEFARFVVDKRYENFVTAIEPGARIFTDERGAELQHLLETDAPLYAWRMLELAWNPNSARPWFDQWRTLPGAEWGPANGFGLKLVSGGGVWEWRADTYVKAAYGTLPIEDPVSLIHDQNFRSLSGGARYISDRNQLQLAFHTEPDDPVRSVGFRVGVPQDSPA